MAWYRWFQSEVGTLQNSLSRSRSRSVSVPNMINVLVYFYCAKSEWLREIYSRTALFTCSIELWKLFFVGAESFFKSSKASLLHRLKFYLRISNLLCSVISVDKFSFTVGQNSAFKLLDSAVSALTYVLTAFVMLANESIDLLTLNCKNFAKSCKHCEKFLDIFSLKNLTRSEKNIFKLSDLKNVKVSVSTRQNYEIHVFM